MKRVTQDQLMKYLKSIDSQYDVRIPVICHDGTRMLGRIEEGQIAIIGGKVPRKTTSVFFPQYDRIFTSKKDIIDIQKPLSKPLFVIGFTKEDLDCLEFIDKFFSANYIDNIYFNKRENAIIAGISGRCGLNGEFLKIAGGKCDFELIYDNGNYVICPYTEAGKRIEAQMKEGKPVSSIDALVKESDALSDEKRRIIVKASDCIRNNKVPAAFWDEISSRCIACTACNLVCPTCTCFDTADWSSEDGTIDRYRIWDSCQLDGFQRETSGHNPMGTESKRTYRRIHHKLAADVERWGFITCMVCGRCDDACPTDIGIQSVCREIVSRFS